VIGGSVELKNGLSGLESRTSRPAAAIVIASFATRSG